LSSTQPEYIPNNNAAHYRRSHLLAHQLHTTAPVTTAAGAFTHNSNFHITVAGTVLHPITIASDAVTTALQSHCRHNNSFTALPQSQQSLTPSDSNFAIITAIALHPNKL